MHLSRSRIRGRAPLCACGVGNALPDGHEYVYADDRRLEEKSRRVDARAIQACQHLIHAAQKEKGPVEAIATRPVFSLTHARNRRWFSGHH